MKLRKHKVISAFLALALLAALLPTRARALAVIDTQKPGSLTIQYQVGDGKAAPGVEFSLYRAADVSASGNFTLTGSFAGYPVSLGPADTEVWRERAGTLAGYAQAGNLTPLRRGTTDSGGMLVFSELTPGLYLVIGGQYHSGSVTYTAEPFLVSLPGLNGEGSEWVYDVTVNPKSSEYDASDPGNDAVDIRVRKSWKDAGSASGRPSSVTVTLMRNGKEYQTVTLNAAGNWRYTWYGLDAADQWSVVERTVPKGYTVLVSETVTNDSIIFLVTNTSETGDDPDPGPSGDPQPSGSPRPSDQPTPSDSPKPSDQPSPSDRPSPSDEPIPSDGPMHSDGPSPSAGPGGPSEPDDPTLPQTGVLWWPVPALLAAGLVLIIIGFVRRRTGDEE